ncbi:MAG: Na+/H+ antiporter subunit C [Hyphomicrobiales bacterium]|jgi:multicomponent Na+:H+ antiporter subunit C|uniref:Na+/H+ antiporter subunit C n=1 Tax=Ahrensia marina TaxID=1514904 RepID=UPI0032FC2C22
MEFILSLLVGVYFAASVYLMLSRHVIRLLLGAALLSNAVNLLIFTAGRLVHEVPPVIPLGLTAPPTVTANPLPQALVLTAIVIAFSIFAFLLVLAMRAYQELGTDDTDHMRVAEPVDAPRPPQGY